MTGCRNGYEPRCAAQIGPEYAYEPVKLTYVLECRICPVTSALTEDQQGQQNDLQRVV